MPDNPVVSMAEKRRREFQEKEHRTRKGPTVYDCPRCGKHIEGDLAVLAHGLLGCKTDSEEKK